MQAGRSLIRESRLQKRASKMGRHEIQTLSQKEEFTHSAGVPSWTVGISRYGHLVVSLAEGWVEQHPSNSNIGDAKSY